MKSLRLSAVLSASFGTLLAISATGPVCRAANVNFQNGGDFNSAANWSDNMPPTLNANVYYVQNNLTATLASGSPSLRDLVVGNDSYGLLNMTGGSLSVLDSSQGGIELGRERFPFGRNGDYNNNGVVDAADYPIWRKTLGQFVVNPGDGADGDQSGTIDQGDYDYWRARFGLATKGGDIIMTGSSILTTNGAVVGRRTKGLLSVGPTALVDVKGINHITSDVRTEYLRVGSYGVDYNEPSQPGLEADGIVIDQGTLNANVLLLNEHGAKGEFRLLPGGKVNLNGGVVMSFCDTGAGPSCGLVANPSHMSSKLSIVGSGGTFNVGRFDATLSPPIDPLDSRPQLRRDIYSDFPATATFSFTADAGGVTPIVLVDNSAFAGEISGTANIAGTNLVLSLDAYTSTSPLTLINAAPGHLAAGAFGTITFLGSRTATVNYDTTNGDVFLNNFHTGSGAGAGDLASSAVPEPSRLMLIALAAGLLLFVNFRVDGRTGRCWGNKWQTVRA
jgi:hypothetical protein